MVILITGATHCDRTLLPQRLLEKYKYPYWSIDLLKTGLIRNGYSCRAVSTPAYSFQGFSENSLHLSGCTTTYCHIARYGMKDSKAVFQLPFIAESGKKSCAERHFNLSRMIFQSQANDFPISTGQNEACLKDGWNILQPVTSILWTDYHETWKMKTLFVKPQCRDMSIL